MSQDQLATNAEVAKFLLKALPIYLAVPLVGLLFYGLLTRENLLRVTLRPFVGYSVGLLAAGVPVLFFPFTRFEVPFTGLDVAMGGFGESPILALLFLLVFHIVAIGVGFLAALVAGRFELLIAAISVWAGVTLGYLTVIYRAISYTAEISPFDPIVVLHFFTTISYPLVALIGGAIAARYRSA